MRPELRKRAKPAARPTTSSTTKASAGSNYASPAAFKAAAMIGPGATRGVAPGGPVGISGTGRPAALEAAAIATFGSSESTIKRKGSHPTK